MDVAIIGAAGGCGRQLAVQLLESDALPRDATVQLVGHRGGDSERELWGLRADLRDAFVDDAPTLEIVLDPDAVDADIVVMLAGATISTDPNATADRAALGHRNAVMFRGYADALRACDRDPLVIVQSNPVELGVEVFAEALGRDRVVGAAAHSDSLRFRKELARDVGVRRPAVTAAMLGQHGDHLVPLWSHVRVHGLDEVELAERVAEMRAGRRLADLPDEIRAAKATMLETVRAGRVMDAYREVQRQPADVRAAVKPFFTHFTAGRTTEVATAHAVTELVEAVVEGHTRVVAAQVQLAGEWLDLHGVVAVPVVLGPHGWGPVLELDLAADEAEALREAAGAIAAASAAVR